MFQSEDRDQENMFLDGNYAAGVDSFEFSTSEAPETIRSDSESPQPASEPEEPFSNNCSLTYRRDFSVNALLVRLGRRDLMATPVPWDIAIDPAKCPDLRARMNAGYLHNHITSLHLALDNHPNVDNDDLDPIPHPLSKMRMFPISGEGALPNGAQHRLDLWRPPGWSGNN
ncbi:hypothetical protein L873DRAFT_1819374 [Choiromyces venosus 120613-1]|uniref:Uncharacterized protein n=1 Tax=Choiromyces venosus 120613-1 TaxID=1336337 RepID=A0A3N4IZK5_9PEZI|nr:hypothetical protein L873DRAFT_1819374 [Choiromyces venosus 120613-1]